MRIQILPLPPITLNDATHTPFVAVFDRTENPTSMAEAVQLRRAAESWGARASIIIGAGESIEISPQIDLPQELQQALLAQLNRVATEEKP